MASPPRAPSLTDRQLEILDIIRHYLRTKGFPPSIREIAAGLGISSISTVHGHLLNLERKGFIRKDPTRRRSIELLKDSDADHREVVFLPVLRGDDLDGPPADTFPLSAEFAGPGESFVVPAEGESMRDAGILHGDMLVVHRQNRVEDGDVVVALVNEEMTVKRYYRADGEVRLQPENARMHAILVKDPRIVGKVVAVIRRL
ncbi:MAG TPA: transcriptional repressor LexA [Candidatus Xenobia bacterium]|jgi:repressor LexA